MESFERCLAEQPEVSINLPGVQPETQRVVNSYESLSEDYPALFLKLSSAPAICRVLKIEWIMGHDIMNDIEVFVPAKLFFIHMIQGMELSYSEATPMSCFRNTIEEAVLHGCSK